MYDNILIPTDGSEVAETAAQKAVSLAERFDAELHAIYVVEPERLSYIVDDARGELTRRGTEAVERIEAQADEAGISTTTAIIDEDKEVHRAILDYASDQEIDLIVMGTHGRGGIGRMVLGSVAEQTLRESPVPVMTVHEDTVIDTSLDSLLVPFDGSESAMAAVDQAIDLAKTTNGTVNFLNIVNYSAIAGGEIATGMVLDALEEAGERALETATERAEKNGVTVGDAAVEVGSPFRTIVEYAAQNDIDCIVMGTHGRSGVDRVLLGSVTERVIRQTELPVIATKAPETDE